MSEQKQAWVYSRIDAPEDSHGTLKHQDQRLCEFAEKMGFEVVGHSQDLDSAYKMDRPGLQALTDAIIDGHVDFLLVVDSSRISLDVKNVEIYGKFLQSFGIKTYSPDKGIVAELSFLDIGMM
ncbi:recombinase family protein [Hungatella effluvii]|uniref:recombinase family protein n=1 Tax=Hungatella effluvii TaxID=1096246 RepID=UPI0022E1D5E2|nr:recombinase family protein [Hungatella effluvii]